jgi:hypothetical protein
MRHTAPRSLEEAYPKAPDYYNPFVGGAKSRPRWLTFIVYSSWFLIGFFTGLAVKGFL